MQLNIMCEFEDGPQTLIMKNVTVDDLQSLEQVRSGDPEAVIGIWSRLTLDGPIRYRLVRVGCIRSAELDGKARASRG